MSNLIYSPNEVRLMQYAEKLFAPLIREGVFDTFELGFKTLLLDYIDRQIEVYKSREAKFETQYKQTFESFTTTIKNRATPEQEDAWQDWEAARTFLQKWQNIRQQVTNNGVAG